MPLLEIEGLTKRFGGVTAVNAIHATVDEAEIVGLIGPNGAGKSTLFAAVTGYIRPDEGDVRFAGASILGKRPDEIAHLGLVRTFQLVKPIGDMTVLENVMIGAMMRSPKIKEARDKAMEVLEFCKLDSLSQLEAQQLTIADKKRMEIARSLATEPKLLLLDEVMSGLNQSETQEAVKLICRINQRGVGLFIVEHVMEVIMPISERVIALDYGGKIAEGTPAEVASDPKVISAYLGKRSARAKHKG